MRALLSVSDLTGLVAFARGLRELGWELVATDGTRAALISDGVDARSVVVEAPSAARALQAGGWTEVMAQVGEGRVNPYAAARRLIENRDAISALLAAGGTDGNGK